MPSLKFVLTGLVLNVYVLSALSAPVSLNEMSDLTLGDAIQKTLLQSPEIRASTKTIEISQAEQQQASLRANPTFSATAEDFLGSGDASGIDAMHATLSLNFVLDERLVDSRGQQASAATELTSVTSTLHSVDVAAETARRFITVLGVEADLEEQQASLYLAQQSLETIRQAVDSGRRHAADLYRAETTESRARLAIEDSEHELRVARHLLAVRWGSFTPDFRNLQGDLSQLPTPKPWAELLTAFDQSPLKEKFLSEERLAESTLALEQTKSRRPLEYQVGIRHLGSSDEFALVAGVSVPLGWRNQNQGNIRAAEKQFEAIEARQAAVTLELQAKLFELYESLEHNLHQAKVLKQEILPSLNEAYKQTQSAFKQGRYSYQELQSVQKVLLETRQLLISNSVQAHLRLIEIERLTGTTIHKEYDL
jgi:outer membrane protein, heavy metal efflux system